MPDLTRDEVQALLDGATPGPWTLEKRGTKESDPKLYGWALWGPAEPELRGDFANEMDARLIAAAPQLAKQYLAALDELDRYRAAISAEQVADALNDAWSLFVAVSDCFPDCIRVERGRGVRLSADFHRGNFAAWVADALAPKDGTDGQWPRRWGRCRCPHCVGPDGNPTGIEPDGTDGPTRPAKLAANSAPKDGTDGQ